MKKVIASFGPPRSKRTTSLAYAAACMVVLMLIAQLFGYEDFANILSSVVQTNDSNLLTVTAGLLVIGELVALPYLLRMYLSLLMRVVSALCGFVVSGFWLLTSLTNAHVSNSGIFSSSLELPGGVFAAIWSAVMFGLVCAVIFADSRFRHAHS